jgi:glycosyltransferase involved in cell wall biosynthesis
MNTNDPSPRSVPILSIVIPAYNAAPFIEETLQSVFAQLADDHEVIVVDDGSADETQALLKGMTDPRLKILRQDNLGVSAARNRGMAAAAGEFLLFLDADDILAPGALARCLDHFAAHPDTVLVYGEAIKFRGDPPQPDADHAVAWGALRYSRPSGDALWHVLTGNPIRTGAAMVRREVALNTGGFPEGVRLGEDWAFWCSVVARGPILWLGTEPLLFYRIHPDSTARRLAVSSQNMREAIDTVFALESVRERFPGAQGKRLRRLSEGAAHIYCGLELLSTRQWAPARRNFQAAIARQPFAISYFVLWACSFFRVIPEPVRRRLP